MFFLYLTDKNTIYLYDLSLSCKKLSNDFSIFFVEHESTFLLKKYIFVVIYACK